MSFQEIRLCESAGRDQGRRRPPPGTDRRDNLSRLTCLDPVQRVTSSEQEQVLVQVKRDD